MSSSPQGWRIPRSRRHYDPLSSLRAGKGPERKIRPLEVDPQSYLDAVFAHAGIPASELTGPSRVARVGYWRQLLAALMANDGMTPAAIGRVLCRHRRTIRYMIDKGRRRLAYQNGAVENAADLREAAARVAA